MLVVISRIHPPQVHKFQEHILLSHALMFTD